jgi:hypothetical protein
MGVERKHCVLPSAWWLRYLKAHSHSDDEIVPQIDEALCISVSVPVLDILAIESPREHCSISMRVDGVHSGGRSISSYRGAHELRIASSSLLLTVLLQIITPQLELLIQSLLVHPFDSVRQNAALTKSDGQKG